MKKPRGLIIAGNWKMNHGPQASREFFQSLAKSWTPALTEATHTSLGLKIFAPAVSLSSALEARAKLPVTIGAQNAHWEKDGAFTGELSGGLLKEIGIESVLIGHSERRQYFAETDETARKRTESLLAQGFEVMFCIGETRAEREAGRTQEVLNRQIDQGMTPQMFANPAKFSIAYEPVWAIGTGLNATPAQAEDAHQMIRKRLWDRMGLQAASSVPLLYGGSVKPDNISSLLDCPNVDGALVGGASLKPDSFLAMALAAAKYTKG